MNWVKIFVNLLKYERLPSLELNQSGITLVFSKF